MMSALAPMLFVVTARGAGAHVLTDAGERWLQWLSAELTRRMKATPVPKSSLLVLWDVLEDWLGSEGFQRTLISGSAELPDPDHPIHAAISANRKLLRRLLEQLATEAGAADPYGLAYQLQILFEGVVVGALIDGRPQVTREARYLTRLALEASGCTSSAT
jgi:hypothetical protein